MPFMYEIQSSLLISFCDKNILFLTQYTQCRTLDLRSRKSINREESYLNERSTNRQLIRFQGLYWIFPDRIITATLPVHWDLTQA